MRPKIIIITAVALVAMCTTVASRPAGAEAPEPIRFATFNASLNRAAAGVLEAQLVAATSDPPVVDPQLATILQIVANNEPDVLLINEFDTGVDGDRDGVTAMFAELAGYDYWYSAPSNTGVPSGFDLNNNGVIAGADDALGFGFFPGQFGMAVFSNYPIDEEGIRTFQTFLWQDMPGALLPLNADGTSWYSPEELDIFRLSSKSHWDVPIEVGNGKVVHFLVSHPTPPVFDTAEDRNGRRNFDEIRFWADYVHPERSGYIYDDEGMFGGLAPGASFVIAGDQNSDPLDGDSVPGAIQQLLDNPRVNARIAPTSEGAVEAAELQEGINDLHRGDPAFDTADFADTQPGNLRADYVLPSKSIRIVDSAVYWPKQGEDGSELTGVFPFPSSDHRLVWVDVAVPGT
jgi:hypothetical protein